MKDYSSADRLGKGTTKESRDNEQESFDGFIAHQHNLCLIKREEKRISQVQGERVLSMSGKQGKVP